MWIRSGDYRRTPAPSAAADAVGLCGIALVFGSRSMQTVLPDDWRRQFGMANAVTMIMSGAFDASLARRDNVRLLVNHDTDSELRGCSVSSEALRLFADKEHLFFQITGSRKAGRRAVQWAKDTPTFREVSIGCRPTKYCARPRDGTEMWNTLIIYEAELEEVSLVKSGAFPGTKVELI